MDSISTVLEASQQTGKCFIHFVSFRIDSYIAAVAIGHHNLEHSEIFNGNLYTSPASVVLSFLYMQKEKSLLFCVYYIGHAKVFHLIAYSKRENKKVFLFLSPGTVSIGAAQVSLYYSCCVVCTQSSDWAALSQKLGPATQHVIHSQRKAHHCRKKEKKKRKEN